MESYGGLSWCLRYRLSLTVNVQWTIVYNKTQIVLDIRGNQLFGNCHLKVRLPQVPRL